MQAKCIDLIAGHPEGTAWLNENFPDVENPSPTQTPETEIGDTFNYQNGISGLFTGDRIIFTYDDVNDEFYEIEYTEDRDGDGDLKPAPFIALFDFFKTRDGDGDSRIWTATIPVCDDGVTNPDGPTQIIGFAKMQIQMSVATSSSHDDNTVEMKIICDMMVLDFSCGYDFARGAGGIYGNAKGIYPNLIQ